MTLFWLLTGLLSLCAVMFVVWPLLRKEESGQFDRTGVNVSLYRNRIAELVESRDAGEISGEEFAALEAELQQELLTVDDHEREDSQFGSRVPLVTAALLVVGSFLLYTDYGASLGAIDDVVLSEDLLETSPHDMSGLQATVERLEDRLKQQPDNDQGWFLLAQSLRSMNEHARAAAAFAHLAGRYPDDAQLAAFEAEMLFLAADRRGTPEVKRALDRGLGLDGGNLSLLEMRAMVAHQEGEAELAVTYFRRALETGVTGDRRRLLEQAITRLGGSAEVAETAADEGRRLQVLVEIDPVVQAGPDSQVYIYARAFEGPPMPLAVQRLTVSGLPALVTLTADQSMMQGMSLNDFERVQLVARISSSGIANASPDDYEAMTDVIHMSDATSVFKLTIRDRRGG